MPIVVTAAKGGSGATTIAAAIVLASTQAGSTPTLVELEGDAGAAFRSISRPDGAPTVDEWLRSAAPPERLDELAAATEPAVLSWAVDRDSSLETTPARPERWRELHAWCVRRELRTGSPVVIDAGAHAAAVLAADGEGSASTLLVTRRCYLGLRRATRRQPPDAIVMIDEPLRALTRRDIERSVGAPVVAALSWDPAIARAIDAGLTLTDAPRPLRRCGAQVLRSLEPQTAALA